MRAEIPIYFRADCSGLLRRMAKDSIGMRWVFSGGSFAGCAVLVAKPFSLAAGVIYAI